MLDFIERFSEIISVIIQSITTIVIFFLAFGKDRYMQSRTVLQSRLENLYCPFYQKFLVGSFHKNNTLSTASIEVRTTFLDLLSKNIQYMNAKSQTLYFAFYIEFLNLLEAYDNNPDFPFAENAKAFDYAFISLSKSLLSEYAHICRQLKLPKPLCLL